MDPRIRYFYKTWYRVPYLVPNWSQAEFRALWKWSYPSEFLDRESPTRDLETALRESFGFEHVVLTSSGRVAIELALKCLDRQGGEVILPAFICGSVAQAVLNAGYIPVPADINDDLSISLKSIEERLSKKTVAVILAHLSGKRARDLDSIVTLCKQKKISLIDDAAQSLGVKHNGRPLGDFGDFGILSFGLGKPTFSIGGGALILKSKDHRDRCTAILQNSAKVQGSGLEDNLSALNFIFEYNLRRATQPLYLAKRMLMQHLRLKKMLRKAGRSISPKEAALQVIQLQKIDETLHKYKKSSLKIINALSHQDDIQFPQRSPDSGYTKLLVLLPNAEGAQSLSTHLLMSGIEVERSYVPLELQKRFESLSHFNNVNARRLWPRLFALPNHPSLKEEDLVHIVKALQRFGGFSR